MKRMKAGRQITTIAARGAEALAATVARSGRAALLACAFAAASLAPTAAPAQWLAPVAQVDGMVVTGYELDQRTRFLTMLRAPGDVRALALDQLVNERLQTRAAEAAGVTVDDEAIRAGIEEFAARGNLSGDQFLQLVAQGGIAPQTIRDFVGAGLIWREYVRATFLPRVSISQAEIDAAMAEVVPEPGLRVLLSEIALPATDPATRRASEKRADRLVGLDEPAFRDAATRFSIAKSRNDGGELSWTDVGELPPAVGAAVRGLQPGATTRPIPVEDEIRVYFLRDRDEVTGGTPATVVDYAALLLAGGMNQSNTAAANKIRAEITSCDQLYDVARGLPPEQLIREEMRESAVPAPFGPELALLDPGEISTRLTTSNGAMVVLMLCQRGNELTKSTTEEAVGAQLRNQRVNAMAQAFIDEARANATIEILR